MEEDLHTENLSSQKRSMFLLNPLELMNIPIMSEHNASDDKKIIDDLHDKLSAREHKEKEQEETNMTSGRTEYHNSISSTESSSIYSRYPPPIQTMNTTLTS